MLVNPDSTWLSLNQNYLFTHLYLLKNQLATLAEIPEFIQDPDNLKTTITTLHQSSTSPFALDQLIEVFKLTEFERKILLLCAGIELDQNFSHLCATLQKDPQYPYPTFSLILSIFQDSTWDAFIPTAPLRYHNLIKISQGFTLTLSPLQIDEYVLHYLMGSSYLEKRLENLVDSLDHSIDPNTLVPSHNQLVDQCFAILSQSLHKPFPPLIQLYGLERMAQKEIAAAACQRLRLSLYKLPLAIVPSTLNDVEYFKQLWSREAILNTRFLLLECNDFVPGDVQRGGILAWLLERTPSLLFITCRHRLNLSQRPVISFEVQKPNYREQQDLWHQTLTPQIAGLDSHDRPQTDRLQTDIQADRLQADRLQADIQRLVANFNLDATKIRTICSEAIARLSPYENSISLHNLSQRLSTELWAACRSQTRPQLEELAQRIEPKATWNDLVLPEEQTKILHEIAAHVRQQLQVYEHWGFKSKESRGLGITALFSGTSGTGKTLAAEVLSHQLQLDLYRIELSAVVSKYIGDTEKNLQKIFDAAEDGSVILLFDEADALFGKRSEVKDSRDRYANVEVSYLLQRMESYPGLAILTTNLKSGIDHAFLRRIRFVIQFPFPDSVQRAEIWRRIFPSQTPLQGIKPERLAQLNIAGGNIRNIALNAAFLAADAHESVQMKHLLQAAQTEYRKLEKTLTEAEINDWIEGEI